MPVSSIITFVSDYKSGFGGQFGVQNDRQDKSAVGWDHQEKLTKHESQKGEKDSVLFRFSSCFVIYFYHCPDYKTGFGGNFGVQSDRVDKSAVGWEHHEKVDKHESQKGSQEKGTMILLSKFRF